MNMEQRMHLARKRAEKLIPAMKLRMRKLLLQVKRLAEPRTNQVLEKIERLGRTMNLQIP